jgi:hypothetical protein
VPGGPGWGSGGRRIGNRLGNQRIGPLARKPKRTGLLEHEKEVRGRGGIVVLETRETRIVIHLDLDGDARIRARRGLRHEPAGIADTVGNQVVKGVQMVVRRRDDREEENEPVKGSDFVRGGPRRAQPESRVMQSLLPRARVHP